jgi:predicted peroxiredoxin
MAKIAVSVTHAHDNTDKATVGFVVANASIASSQETIIFLSIEGVRLAVLGEAEKISEPGFAPLKELLDKYIAAGGTIWVCSPCFKKRGLDETKLVKNATIVGGATLVEFLSKGASCISY